MTLQKSIQEYGYNRLEKRKNRPWSIILEIGYLLMSNNSLGNVLQIIFASEGLGKCG